MRSPAIYPRYYGTPEGDIQIKILEGTHVYARAVKKGKFYDYCVYHGPCDLFKEIDIEKAYQTSDEDNYLVVLKTISSYFKRISENLEAKYPQLKELDHV